MIFCRENSVFLENKTLFSVLFSVVKTSRKKKKFEEKISTSRLV